MQVPRRRAGSSTCSTPANRRPSHARRHEPHLARRCGHQEGAGETGEERIGNQRTPKIGATEMAANLYDPDDTRVESWSSSPRKTCCSNSPAPTRTQTMTFLLPSRFAGPPSLFAGVRPGGICLCRSRKPRISTSSPIHRRRNHRFAYAPDGASSIRLPQKSKQKFTTHLNRTHLDQDAGGKRRRLLEGQKYTRGNQSFSYLINSSAGRQPPHDPRRAPQPHHCRRLRQSRRLLPDSSSMTPAGKSASTKVTA